jgi:TolB-like protein
MKNIISAIILGVAMTGAAFAQRSETKMAVVEFTPMANATGMNAEGKRQVQTGIAASLANTRKFYVYDVRHTRTASQAALESINSKSSTAAAVKLGKQLDVAYVLTGTVTEFTPKGADGHGSAAIHVRMIEVKTGKVTYSGDLSARSGKPMRTGAQPEMQAYVWRHIIDQLTVLITGDE